MGATHWTPQQQNCIDARGGTVLVSAAAGSGKTAVLIERIVSLLNDSENPVDIDQMLIVTFTKAAAAEMRSRLNKRLSEELAQDPHNRHLLRQQMLLPQASICTIDSFCVQLLREHAPQVGISPRFRVAEDTTLRLLKQHTADDVINTAYQTGSAEFSALCEILVSDRSDRQLSEQLLRTYDFIQAHPFPLEWLDRQQMRFENIGAIRETTWGTILLEQAREDLTSARDALATAIDAIAQDERIQSAYGPSLSLSLSAVIDALHATDRGWDDAARAVNAISFERFKTLKGYEDEGFKAYITALRDHAKQLTEKHVKPFFTRTEAQAIADITAAAPPIKALFDLVRRFTDAFAAAKAEQNLLDFNDMEHLALSLLARPDGHGGFLRTEAAKTIGARFSHIMVDEYQDTNATQDTLFAALSKDEDNLFFVGDIKQSIYGFRQAMPSIFRGRRERSTPFNGVDFPAAITLGNNFRSRPQVTNSVNFVFRLLMGEKTGGIVYDEREELVSSAIFEAAEDPAYNTELLIIEKKALKEELNAHQAEARVIGQRILAMIRDGFCVSEKSGRRQATYRDFCILLRSTSRTAPIFVKELQAMGIPVASGSHENFFDCAEIRLILSLLRAIDNPLLDIPLLAALLSPIFGFSPDDLAVIRTAGKDLSLFTALRRCSRNGHPLSSRCRAFLDTLDTYRMLAAAMPADRLIYRIYEDTDLLSIMSAKSGGTQRIANLRKFYDLARHFEQDDFRGLSAFVRHMDKLEAQGIPVPTADQSRNSQNAVQLMTIHHSKGLEFPVVFLAGLGSDFNTASVRVDVLLHAEYGVGLAMRNRETLTESDPFHRKAIAAAITRSERTEELRVLYVAMTRAKDKLFLLQTVDRLQPTLERLHIACAGSTATLPPSFILHAARMSDWLLAAFLMHDAGASLQEALRGTPPKDCTANGLSIRVTTPEHMQEAQHPLEVDRPLPSLDEVAQHLNYVYPYAALGHIAAKITASQTAHHADTGAFRAPQLAQPAFLSKGGLTPAQRGTATHIFLEHVVLDSPQSAHEQAQAMVDRDLLTEAQKNALDMKRLQRFLQSPLAARMASSTALLREFPFAIERPIGDFDVDLTDLPCDAKEEQIMIQGIADAVFEEDGGLVIVDYKTDRVESGDELSARYRSQLAVYKEALERTLQRQVKACLIYSFHLGEAVTVD